MLVWVYSTRITPEAHKLSYCQRTRHLSCSIFGDIAGIEPEAIKTPRLRHILPRIYQWSFKLTQEESNPISCLILTLHVWMFHQKHISESLVPPERIELHSHLGHRIYSARMIPAIDSSGIVSDKKWLRCFVFHLIRKCNPNLAFRWQVRKESNPLPEVWNLRHHLDSYLNWSSKVFKRYYLKLHGSDIPPQNPGHLVD